jgi:hypothetical protein
MPPFIELVGMLAKETWNRKLAAQAKPKENVELLHNFVKSQLKPNRKR